MENVVQEIQPVASAGARARIVAYTELTKPRIAFMLVLTSAAGFYLGAGDSFRVDHFLYSMLGIALLAFGVATLNQYIERQLDAMMERTAGRPLPTRRLTHTEALIFGIVLTVAAEIVFYLAVNLLTAILGLLVIVGYIFVYTPLKTRTSVSTAIGAIPGAMPPLMGWTAATNEITIGAWILFAILFLWQFPHFFAIAWMYRDQYERAGILMLPVVEPEGNLTARQIILFTLMLIPISLAPFFFAMSGLVYLISAIILGGIFLAAGIQIARTKSNQSARRLLLVSVLYLPLLLLIMSLDK
jgi:protoheme IX farnesyltransferase